MLQEGRAHCERCLHAAESDRANRGPIARGAVRSPELLDAMCHARMRAVALSIEVGTTDADTNVPAQVIWSKDTVKVFDALHAKPRQGTRKGGWRRHKPTNTLAPEEFGKLVAADGGRWEVLHSSSGHASFSSSSAPCSGAAFWRGPRIIMDTGCGDSIISFDYAKAAGLKLVKVPRREAKTFIGVGGNRCVVLRLCCRWVNFARRRAFG